MSLCSTGGLVKCITDNSTQYRPPPRSRCQSPAVVSLSEPHASPSAQTCTLLTSLTQNVYLSYIMRLCVPVVVRGACGKWSGRGKIPPQLLIIWGGHGQHPHSHISLCLLKLQLERWKSCCQDDMTRHDLHREQDVKQKALGRFTPANIKANAKFDAFSRLEPSLMDAHQHQGRLGLEIYANIL
ncbi:hypothetical protein JOB18_036990 [Solea senegalensis]|uniref:Uncharacterized protein n=1 Tax=Solea senegalensis TaxID=28829 RepID=A0AAV6R920_SOLSE|nr:hypothetical protein JOB18_036990 [Solea senegalensis]